MRNYLTLFLFVLAIAATLRAADEADPDEKDLSAQALRAEKASSTAPATRAAQLPLAKKKEAGKPDQGDGPGYTQLGGTIILHLDREKTELTLYEKSAYSIVFGREGVSSRSDVPDRGLVEIKEVDLNTISFRGLKPGVVWLSLADRSKKRYSVGITIIGDTRTLTSQLKKLYPNSNIKAIKVGKGVLLRGEVSKPEHTAEVIEIAEQHYPKALNQLKVGTKTKYVVPLNGPYPVPIPVYRQPVGRAVRGAQQPIVPEFRRNGRIGVLPIVFEVDWQRLAKSNVNLVSELRGLESVPKEWEDPSTPSQKRVKQTATYAVTVPRNTAGRAIQTLNAIRGVDLVRMPEMALSTHKPARVSISKMFPVTKTTTLSDGKRVPVTRYIRAATTLTLTTDQNGLNQANLGFELEHEFPIDGTQVDVERDVSAGFGSHQLSGTVRLQSDQAVIVAETVRSAGKLKQPVVGKGLVVMFVPAYVQVSPAAASSVQPAVIAPPARSLPTQPAAVAPNAEDGDLRDSVRQLRGDVRVLRKDVRRLLKLLENQTSVVPTAPKTVGEIRQRIKKSKNDLLVFHATWSGPCRKMAPRLDAQAERGYSIQRLDIDEHRELAQDFHVTVVPTIIAFTNGKEEERWTGILGNEALTRIVDKYAPRRRAVTWKDIQKLRSTTAKRNRLEALDREVSVEFKETPLEDAIRQISTKYDLNIMLNRRGLEEEGVTPKTPVTVSAREIKLSSVLNLILRPLNLAQQVRDEVLVVTSRQRSRGELIVVTYPVADLVIAISASGIVPAKKAEDGVKLDDSHRLSLQSPAADFDKLITTIQSNVQPNSWNVVGGLASLQPFEASLSLVIRQTSQAHAEIADLLHELRRLQDMQVTVEPHYLDGIPDQLWENIEEQLKSKQPDGAAKGVAILSNAEAKLVLEAVRGNEKSTVMPLPKVTLFNGQTGSVARSVDGGKQPGLPQLLHIQPVISADRRDVRLNLQVIERASHQDRKHSFVRTVPDGKTLLVEVAEEGNNASGSPDQMKSPYLKQFFKDFGDQPRTGRRFLLVRPRIIVPEEEEELLGIPVKK